MLLFLALLAVAPRPSRVEAQTPKAPTPVLSGGKRVLAYELQITNFDARALTLQRIEIFDGAQRIAELAGAGLAKCLAPVGEPAPADPAHLDSGRRVVAYLWLALPVPPRTLRHKLTFDESSIDGISVPVLTAQPPVLQPFFESGEWYAGNGPSNFSVHRRSLTPLNGRTYVSQRFAVDWILIGKNGDSVQGDRSANEHYWGFGQPVHAMAAGEVTEVVDEFEDHLPGKPPPVTLEGIAGNHVIVRIAPEVYVVYAHLKLHSIRVRLGQPVKAGEMLGALGDSGNSSGPHLHVEVVDGNSVLGAEGIPWVLERFRFLGHGKDFDAAKHPDERRSLELPADDDVVGRF